MATVHPSVRLVLVSPEAPAICRDAPKAPDVEGPASTLGASLFLILTLTKIHPVTSCNFLHIAKE